jgi:uncharacterized protein (UPF0548 family)
VTLRAHLTALANRQVSFTAAPFRLSDEPSDGAQDGPPAELSTPLAPPGAPPPLTRGWTVERHETRLGHEPPGPPLADGLFARARLALHEYRFADPRITHGHYDPLAPLLGRDLLVEARALIVHLLVGLRVSAVLDRADATETRFGIRLDTLEGHILHGSEWILVAKEHRTGAVRLRIEARWRPGQLPAWWMGLGFRLLGRQTQARWRRQAARRLRALGS